MRGSLVSPVMCRRVAVAAALAGSALLAATPGWAGPDAPAPTASTAMTTPAGTTPAPNVRAAWTVSRPGRDASLTVTGAVTPLAPVTVAAVWTSAPRTIKHREPLCEIDLQWSTGPVAVAGSDGQVIRVRFGDAHGWGPWGKPAYRSPLTVSALDPAESHGASFDVWYSGRLPRSAMRVQVSLTDTLSAAETVQQSLDIHSV